MRKCIFCGRGLGRNRAKEHVLRQEWLRLLGAQKQPLRFDHLRGNTVEDSRHMGPLGLQAGETCGVCNGGWMSHLDQEAGNLILPLAKNPQAIPYFTRNESRRIGRWMLKVAVAFESTTAPHRRHIPRSVIDKLQTRGYLPSGFFLFAATSFVPMKGVSATLLDIWSPETGVLLEGQDQRSRLKFGLQYDNLLLACGYMLDRKPTYSVPMGIHHPVFLKDASVAYRWATPDRRTWFDLPAERGQNWLNYFVASIDLLPSGPEYTVGLNG